MQEDCGSMTQNGLRGGQVASFYLLSCNYLISATSFFHHYYLNFSQSWAYKQGVVNKHRSRPITLTNITTDPVITSNAFVSFFTSYWCKRRRQGEHCFCWDKKRALSNGDDEDKDPNKTLPVFQLWLMSTVLKHTLQLQPANYHLCLVKMH